MPIKCVISVPSQTVTGAFNTRYAFARAVETLNASNIRIDTESGDPIGENYRIQGKGKHWYILHRILDGCVGSSEITLTGSVNVNGTSEAIDARAARIIYDTRRIVRCVMTAPTQTVKGKFNIRLTFARNVQDLDLSNVDIETVSGDPISGDPIGEDVRVWGEDGNWYLTFKIPDARVGRSQITLTGSVIANGALETLDAKAVTIDYDTRRSLMMHWGEIRYGKNQLTLPITFETDVIGLTKKHFRLTAVSGHSVSRLRCYLYGKDKDYELVFIPNGYRRGVFTVEIARPVHKTNGIRMDVEIPPVEIRYPERMN